MDKFGCLDGGPLPVQHALAIGQVLISPGYKIDHFDTSPQKERAAGREPKKPEAFFVWDRNNFLTAIQANIKDAAELKGGPYKRYVLVVHTNEMFLPSKAVGPFLQGATFQCQQITDAILGLSYEPGNGYPTFRLALTGRETTMKRGLE